MFKNKTRLEKNLHFKDRIPKDLTSGVVHKFNVLDCCKLQIVFKNKARLGNKYHFKDRIPIDLTPGVFYELLRTVIDNRNN